MDTYGEQGRFVGLLLRRLLRGRTRNPILIILLLLFGLTITAVTLWSLLLPFYPFGTWNVPAIPGPLLVAFFLLIGVFAIVRAVDSILAITREHTDSAR